MSSSNKNRKRNKKKNRLGDGLNREAFKCLDNVAQSNQTLFSKEMEEAFSGPLRINPVDLELQKLICGTGKLKIDPLRTYIVNKTELEEQIREMVRKEFQNVFQGLNH